jgi:hypothetical protein
MMDTFPRGDVAMSQCHFPGTGDGPCIPWGIENAAANQPGIPPTPSQPGKRQWHEFFQQQGTLASSVASFPPPACAFPSQRQYTPHIVDPPVMSFDLHSSSSSSSSEEEEEQGYQQRTSGFASSSAMEISSPARPFKRRRTVSNFRPPDSPFLLSTHNTTVVAMQTGTPSCSQNSLDTSMESTSNTSMEMLVEQEENEAPSLAPPCLASSSAASTRLPVVEWWKRPRRSLLPIATILEEDHGPKRLVSLEEEQEFDESCSNDDMGTCRVCQKEFPLPLPSPPVTPVMPVNSLLQYFAPKQKSLLGLQEQDGMETACRKRNGHQKAKKKSPASCGCCDRLVCDHCRRECQNCSQRFCAFCVVESNDDSLLCLDCDRDVTWKKEELQDYHDNEFLEIMF